MPNKVKALRNRVALYRSYLRVGARGDLAIEYMRQIAEDLDAINKVDPKQIGGEAFGRSPSAPVGAD
jgi:hypothetical protein